MSDTEDNKDPIANKLGIEPLKTESAELEEVKSGTDLEEMEHDFTEVRQNLHDLVAKGTDALDEMIELAKISQSPRAFEVVATLMKSVVDTNKEIVDLAKKKQDIIGEVTRDRPNVVNNNLNITTSALIEMIKGNFKDDSE
jgi:DNA-binding ferritin-like protein